MMPFVVAIGGLTLALMISWFRILDSSGRSHRIFVVLVGAYVVEAVVTSEASSVPFGLLRPRILGQDFRPVDLVIFAAIAARTLSSRPIRVGRLELAWAPFVLLYFVGVIAGLWVQLPFVQVLFQGKLLLYLFGGAMVASQADPDRVAASIGRLATWLAPLVPIGLIVETTGARIAISTPVQRLPTLGRFSNDTITIFVVIGAAALVAELVRDRQRVGVIVAGVVLMAAPLSGDQRASYLTLVACIGALFFVLLGPTQRRRSPIGPTHVFLGGAVMVAMALVGVAAGPLTAIVDDAFAGQANEDSAEARVGLYEEAAASINEHVLIGSGVGAQVESTKPATGAELVTTAHNVLLDVLLRVGAIGLVAFVVALAVSLWTGFRVWRDAPTDGAAAVGIGAVLGLVGWFAKAMVEPGLDKYRLAMVLGLSVGLLNAAWRATVDHQRAAVAARQTELV